jgi:aspartyl-tRNA synthetase
VEIEAPFPRLPWSEADARYGSDKPDLRFGLEIEDATEATRGAQFGVFANAEAVRFLRVPRVFSRGDLAKLEEIAKEWGAKGLAYLVYDGGEVRSPIAKFLSEEELAALGGKDGETLLFAADDYELTSRVLGPLRLGRGRAALERSPPPVHAPDRRVEGSLPRGPEARARARVRPHRQRERARRRQLQDPRARGPGEGL